MSSKRSLSHLVLILLITQIVLFSITYLPRITLCIDDASTKISQAENAISEAFSGALQAEAAGANVTGILAELNSAQDTLNLAKLALRNGNSADSINKADSAINIAHLVSTEASETRAAAIVNAKNVFLFNIIFSLSAVSIFLVGLVLIWRWIKRRYYREFAKMRPTVAKNEA